MNCQSRPHTVFHRHWFFWYAFRWALKSNSSKDRCKLRLRGKWCFGTYLGGRLLWDYNPFVLFRPYMPLTAISGRARSRPSRKRSYVLSHWSCSARKGCRTDGSESSTYRSGSPQSRSDRPKLAEFLHSDELSCRTGNSILSRSETEDFEWELWYLRDLCFRRHSHKANQLRR